MSYWTEMNVLVTGAGGFIGSHLCERLVRAGARVTALIHYRSDGSIGNLAFVDRDVRESLRIVAGDVRDISSLESLVRGQRTVFHLASLIGIPYSYTTPFSYLHTNVGGTLNILEACRRHDVERVVHTSTSEVFGTARHTPMDEGHPQCAQSPYAASKIGADQMVASYHLAFDLPTVTIRPFNAFGPRQSARAVIPTIIVQALWEPEIRLGGTSSLRDFTYVEDTVDAFVAGAACGAAVGRTINVGSGRALAIGHLVEVIQRQLGTNKRVVLDLARVRPTRSEVERLVCDATLARELLGWSPRFDLETGLRRTIEFVSAQRDAARSGEYAV